MLNNKFVKLNKILFLSLVMTSAALISACGNNANEEVEETAPTTTLSYQESLEERMEQESIKKESFESLKESINESKKIENESIEESASLHAAEVEEILKDIKEYRETRDDYINNKKESLKNINVEEIIKQYEESEVKNEN